MAPLSDAPNEIIAHILSFIPRSDLPNLCRTNKSLRRSAEPFLYSTIILEWKLGRIPQIIPLLRTLFQRPELYDLLDTISMNGWSFFGKSQGHALDLDSAGIPFEQYAAAIEKTGVPYTDLWIKKLKSGNTCLEALCALLLANLSKTRRLGITHNFINGRDLIGKVLQSKVFSQFNQLPAFEHLKEIRYVKEYDYHTVENNNIFTDVISLFYLPTVTNIVAWVPNPSIFHWPAVQEPNLDHITSLDIMRLSEQHLEKILTLTRNLKSLLWTWDYDDSHDPWKSSTLDLDKIATVLSHVKVTLEKLQFRLEITGGYNPEFTPKMTVLGCLSGLADFDQLTYLEVPLICLAGFGDKPQPLENSIPTMVETLALSEDMLLNKSIEWQKPYYARAKYASLAPCQGIEELIESLADSIPMKLPQLRHLIFLNDGDFKILFQRMGLNKMMDIYCHGFDYQVSTRELPVTRYCFGWRNIPSIDYTKRGTGPRWATK